MKNKKVIIIAVAVFVVVGAILAATLKGNKNNTENIDNTNITTTEENASSENNKAEESTETTKQEETDSAETKEENTKTPVFMYFVSESDANYDEAIKVFEELKKEYEGKIEFDLRNITKNPEILDNFSLVDGNTPTLIMDGKEGITGMQFKMTDKATLKAEIEKAL